MVDGFTKDQNNLVRIFGCTCIGQIQTYECNIIGEGTTVWQGTAFNCPGNAIRLRHIDFGTEAAAGDCNNRAIVGRGYRRMNNTYISQLNITVDSGLNGRSVECAYASGSNLFSVATETITLTTGTESLLIINT